MMTMTQSDQSFKNMQSCTNKEHLQGIVDKVGEYLKIPKVQLCIMKYNPKTFAAYANIEHKQIYLCPNALFDEMYATTLITHECCHFRSIYHTKKFKEIEKDALLNVFNYQVVSYKKSSTNIMYVNKIKTRLATGGMREMVFHIP